MAKAYVQIDWADVPHLSSEQIESMLASIPPWQRAMRRTGIPSFGSGAIYPIPESEITVTPFEIPAHWPRAFGFDVGWNVNAAVFGALDSATGTTYIYHEVYLGKKEPSVIAAAIKTQGAWMPGTIDPASAGSGQKDGKKLIEEYRDVHKLDLEPADNAVVTGLTRVWEQLSTGRLKIFTNCQKLLGEYRLYRRDERGQIVASPDHALDALRYLCMSGLDRAIVEPKQRKAGDLPWWHVRPAAVWAG
jgi:hypothetical protein